MNWSIIIFAFNEAESLTNTVHRCEGFLRTTTADHEMILVDDGSTDNTPEICRHLLSKHEHLRVIRQPVNMGIGHALLIGYAAAKHDYVCAVPGDGQFDPDELLQVPAFDDRTFVSFYRTSQNYSLYRQMLSQLNRLLNRWILGLDLRDVNWVKVYRRSQLADIPAGLTSSIVESGICARLVYRGHKVLEIASIYHDRSHGIAKGGRWKTVSQVLREMHRLYLFRSTQ